MAKLKVLRDRAAEIVHARQTLLDEAGDEGISEEQEAKFQTLGEQLTETKAAIERYEQVEREITALNPRNNGAEFETGGGTGDGQEPEKKEEPKFESFGHMLQAVAVAGKTGGARVDDRLLAPLAATGLSEGVPADGGFLVGTETTHRLLTHTYDNGLIASKCDRMPIGPGKNGMKINGVDDSSRADGSQWGGIVVYWESEAAEKTASKPKFVQTELSLHKLIGLCYATDELLEDAVALEALIMKRFPDAFAFKVDNAIIRGTGAGQPKGILAGPNNAPRVRVAKETGQAATTIVAENIEKMYSRMIARGMIKANWFINQDCWPQIFQLHHVIGTGGVPMFIPAGGLNQAPFGTLLGRPILPIEQASTLGTEGDIIFANFNEYVLIDKGGIKSASSIHVRFVYDESVFRFVLRIDGAPLDASSQTPAQGTNTVSPFVTLATRS